MSNMLCYCTMQYIVAMCDMRLAAAVILSVLNKADIGGACNRFLLILGNC